VYGARSASPLNQLKVFAEEQSGLRIIVAGLAMAVSGEAVRAAVRRIEECAILAVPLEVKAFALLAKPFVLLNLHQEVRSC